MSAGARHASAERMPVRLAAWLPSFRTPSGAAPPPRRREPASAGRHRGRRGRFLSACIRRAAAGALLSLAALFALPALPGAGTAWADSLTSNLGQTTSATTVDLSTRDVAQAFTTGSTADAYEFTGVKVEFATVPSASATVTAFIADGRGATDVVVVNLTNPPTWSTVSTFAAPDDTTLDPSTTYYLIIEATDGILASTSSGNEDSGGVSGWSIADSRFNRAMVSDSGLGGAWSQSSNTLHISVEGDHKGAVTTCSAASMEDQVWTGNLTVGEGSGTRGFGAGFGTLSDTTLSYDGTHYTISDITENNLSLLFAVTTTGGFGTKAAYLTLHVGSNQYAFDDADVSAGNHYAWTSNVPIWIEYDRVCLAVTGIDTTPPALTGAQVTIPTFVNLFFDETLDSTSIPDKSAFTVEIEGNPRTVTSASRDATGKAIRVDLAAVVRPGETVTVSYTKPRTNPLKDAADNETASFTDFVVTNTLASTAPEAPGNLTATAGTVADTMALNWDTPWANGNDITKFQVRYAQGSTAGETWADILNSDADTTTHTVTELTTGAEYTFEVHAVNGIGNGAAATVTATTVMPTWELTLTDLNGNAVTELVEGGASATVTVRITNGVTFTAAQTVTLLWDGLVLDAASPIQGASGASAIIIIFPGQSSGTLVISAPPDPGGVAAYTPPRTAPLWGRHGENRISGIDLTFRDDEEPPVATLTAQPAQVSEGEAIEVEISLSLPYGDNATSTLQLIVTDAAGALVAPLPTGAEFDPGELTHAITLTAADNAVHNDGARVVTVALAPDPGASLYTLGAPSSATVVVADNDNVAPVFSDGASATRSVAENTAAGENVGAALTATDVGDTLTYTLEGADAASFDIVTTSGQIRTRSGVTYDHEARSSYSVTVKADDGNAGNATTAVTITVTDVAEPPAAPAAPTVTATSASTTSLDVTWPAPANAGKPAISGYGLRYRAGISGSWTDGPQNRPGASASIASLTAGTSYQVQVRATNAEGDGPWSASGTGSTGTSSNTAPTFANPTATRSVPENSAADTNVGAVVTATDTDADDTLTYTLEGAGAASFDIVSTSGQIRTRSGVTYDHEAKSSYSVTVKADDGNAGNATVAVTITVTDVAEPPAPPAAPTVTATSASTTSVDVTWTAPANPGKPAISGYDLRYRAGISGSWTDGPQNRTGASASIASLTAGTSYQVQVRATNAEGDGPWSASGSGSTGTSSNTAPTFANPTATRSVPENSAADTNVGAVVTATDTDAGDTLTYTLEGADAASFDIVSTSGQIRTRPGVTYDHEARSSYSVTVKADDGNAGTATVAVTITVTDVAEPPAAPAWELTLTDSNGNAVTELVEGGAPATATVSITNAVTFSTAQTVTLEWDDSPLDAASPIQGSGGASEITIPANQSNGSLVISAPDPGGVAAYTPPRSASVLGRHGATRIGGIDLTFSDDEEPPVATLTAAPAQVSEGEGIEVEISLSLAYGDNATSTLQLIVTDAAGALVAPLPTEAEFDPGELTHAITLTAADNAVHNDGAREVTVALAPNADVPYTLGNPSSVTVTVLDNDTPPATPMADAPDAPRSLTAEGGNQEVTLRWLAPASNGGSAILRYQYRRRYRSQAYGDWTDIANSAPGEANANSYTVTGLANGTLYTFEVRAVNTGGPGAESNEVVETPVPVTKLRASQKAWMARFDRTVATQVVDAIGARFSGGGNQGVTVGGQSLNRTGGAVDDARARERLLAEPGEPGAEPKVLSMTGRELLLGSSFSFGGGGKDGAPSWGAWGRFATGGFEADADGMRVEGDVTTGLLGADASRGRWLAGVAVSLSRGEGPFQLMSAMDSNRGRGTVESSLTALYPYAKLGLSDRMEAWGMVGLGTGELTVRESGGTPIETDLGMTMGAVGARGRLLSAGEGGGLDLALRSDAMWVRMKSDAVSNGDGNLAAAQALVSRLRLIVEGSRTFAMADERTITPRGEVGVRHDLGDAETGTGLEVGAGVKFAGDGFSIEGAVRALVAHEDAHYREWGASGAIRVDPGAAGRGFSLSIAPTWGNAASEAARLWSARDAGGLVRSDGFEAKSRLEAELGYGVGAPRGPGLVTPYAGFTLSGGAHRAVRTGLRWNASPGATMSLEASREAQGSGEAPANALTLRAEVRW